MSTRRASNVGGATDEEFVETLSEPTVEATAREPSKLDVGEEETKSHWASKVPPELPEEVVPAQPCGVLS